MTRLAVGLRYSKSLLVDERLTVPHVSPAFGSFKDMPPVFATAYLVGFIEATCIEALAGFLEPGQKTVGTRIDVTHIAATPVGMSVNATVELVEIAGRRLRFQVEGRDERDEVGSGTHERALIDTDRFMEKLKKKAPQRADQVGG